jgi:hypothetical protein
VTIINIDKDLSVQLKNNAIQQTGLDCSYVHLNYIYVNAANQMSVIGMSVITAVGSAGMERFV